MFPPVADFLGTPSIPVEHVHGRIKVRRLGFEDLVATVAFEYDAAFLTVKHLNLSSPCGRHLCSVPSPVPRRSPRWREDRFSGAHALVGASEHPYRNLRESQYGNSSCLSSHPLLPRSSRPQ